MVFTIPRAFKTALYYDLCPLLRVFKRTARSMHVRMQCVLSWSTVQRVCIVNTRYIGIFLVFWLAVVLHLCSSVRCISDAWMFWNTRGPTGIVQILTIPNTDKYQIRIQVLVQNTTRSEVCEISESLQVCDDKRHTHQLQRTQLHSISLKLNAPVPLLYSRVHHKRPKCYWWRKISERALADSRSLMPDDDDCEQWNHQICGSDRALTHTLGGVYETHSAQLHAVLEHTM